jgi:hypothetical protein
MTTNFEDLPIEDFLQHLSKLNEFSISAQADGLDFFFGFDKNGNFFTSPYSANKQEKFNFSPSDYPHKPENNTFISAHAALEKKVKMIAKFLQPGEAISAQLTSHAAKFTESATNIISIINGAKGEVATPDSQHVHELAHKLATSKILVSVKQIDTTDGEELHTITSLEAWKVVYAKRVSGSHLDSSKFKSLKLKLKAFLSEPNKQLEELGLSNHQVLTTNLTSIDLKQRPKVKAERERLNSYLLQHFKLPIKAELLVNLENKLGTNAGLIHSKGDDVRIVDSEVSEIGRFDTMAKRKVAGIQRTTDSSASVEDQGGLLGIFEQRISELLGVPELSMYQSAAKIFRELHAKSPNDAARKFAVGLGHLDFNGVKQKINAVINSTLKQLSEQLANFKDNALSFKLITGDSDKTVTLTPAQYKRNLLAFAEAKEHLLDLQNEVKHAKTFAELILSLYGPIIYGVVQHGLHEGIIEEGNIDTKFLTTEKICHAYTATLLAAQLLLRAKDKQASTMLKDARHANLNKFEAGLSPLNYWGCILFSPFLADMKGQLNSTVAKDLKKIAGRFILPRVKKIHITLSANTNMEQDWNLQEENARLVSVRLSTRSTVINTIITGTKHWTELDYSDKHTVVARTFYYLQQAVPNSPLLGRIRYLANNVLTMANQDSETIKDPVAGIQENLLASLLEVEMGAFTASASNNSYGSSTWTDIGTAKAPDIDGNTQGQVANRANKTDTLRMYHGRHIVKRKRDYERKKRFERPNLADLVHEDDAGSTSSAVDGGTPNGELYTSSGAIATYPQKLFGGKGKKKKRIIKRLIPTGYDLKEFLEKRYSIILSWPDADFTGNAATDPGFKLLKEHYKINAELIYEKALNGWPVVKLEGSKQQLIDFLTNVYEADAKIISSITLIGDK